MNNDINIDVLKNLIVKLGKERPIFHSEADFQHAFAWKIKERFNEVEIRLERSFGFDDGRKQLDLFLKHNNECIGFEFKYKTKALKEEINSEWFHLKNQGASSHARYDYIADIKRLMDMIKDRRIDRGYAIKITNVKDYWAEPKNKNTSFEKFRIHNGATLTGQLTWQPTQTKSGKPKKDVSKDQDQRPEIDLGNKEFHLIWHDYSIELGFKYLITEVV